MKTPVTKIAVVVLIGAGVAVLGYRLFLGQAEPIEPFEYLSFLTGLAGFVFALFQVVHWEKSAEYQKAMLIGLWKSSNANIARIQQIALSQDPTRGLLQALIGVLQQEQIHLEGLLQANYQAEPSSYLLLPNHASPEASIELIEGREEVRNALTALTASAQGYIYIVGGRSRDREYLDCLLNRVKRGDIEYTRIVTGDHIREPLFEHLASLGSLRSDDDSNIKIGYLDEDKYGSFTVTRDGVFWALPSSTQTQLTSGVIIHSSKVASDFRAHVITLLGGQKEPKDLEFFRSICKEFHSR